MTLDHFWCGLCSQQTKSNTPISRVSTHGHQHPIYSSRLSDLYWTRRLWWMNACEQTYRSHFSRVLMIPELWPALPDPPLLIFILLYVRYRSLLTHRDPLWFPQRHPGGFWDVNHCFWGKLIHPAVSQGRWLHFQWKIYTIIHMRWIEVIHQLVELSIPREFVSGNLILVSHPRVWKHGSRRLFRGFPSWWGALQFSNHS